MITFANFLKNAIEVQSGENEKKIRENNEHQVPRPFTPKNNEQIDIRTKQG